MRGPEVQAAESLVVPLWIKVLGTALMYVVLARIGLQVVIQPEGIAAFWPANGFATGVLILAQRRYWKWYAAGMVAAVLAVNVLVREDWLLSCGFALINTAECCGAAWALQRFLGFPRSLDQ